MCECDPSCSSSIADNLPVATRLEFYPIREAGGEDEQKKDVVKDVQFEHGYRLGFVDSNKVENRDKDAVLCSNTHGSPSLGGRLERMQKVLTASCLCPLLVLPAQPPVLHPVLP